MQPLPSIPDLFSRAFEAVFTSRSVTLYAAGIAAVLVPIAAAATGAAGAIYAATGTLDPDRLVDTDCFVEVETAGGTTSWDVLPGCEVWPTTPDWSVLIVAGLAAGAATLAVWLICSIALARASDNLVGARLGLEAVPPLGEFAQMAGRVLGWGLLVYVMAGVALTAATLGTVAVAAAVPTGVAVLLLFGAWTIGFIWLLVPLTVRLSLTFALLMVENRSFASAWGATEGLTLGRAWAVIGMSLVAGMAFGIGSSMLGAVAGDSIAVAAVVTLVVDVVQVLFYALFLIAVARNVRAQEDQDPPGAPAALL